MRTIKEIKKDLAKIAPTMKRLANDLEELRGDLDKSTLDTESLSELYQLLKLADPLDAAAHNIEFLNKAIVAEGVLYKNSAGRYAINDDYYFTSGSGIEILVYDDMAEHEYWLKTAIEHNGEDYYATARPALPLSNFQARARG